MVNTSHPPSKYSITGCRAFGQYLVVVNDHIAALQLVGNHLQRFAQINPAVETGWCANVQGRNAWHASAVYFLPLQHPH